MSLKQLAATSRRRMLRSFGDEGRANLWFLRLAALSYMEKRGYLPPDTVRGLYLTREGELALRLRSVMAELSPVCPPLFDVGDGEELLDESGVRDVLGGLCDEINSPELSDVRIIGWMHQFYNSELKDEAFAVLKEKKKISRKHLPAATQLFTPDWVVKYMVESSVGEQYLASKESDSSARERLARKMGFEFYLSPPRGTDSAREFDPRSFRVIDPCVGAGHILVYALRVLIKIYEREGVPQKESPRLILENNLFGLDIDPVVSAVANFSLLMCAAEYDRDILKAPPRINVYSVPDPAAFSASLSDCGGDAAAHAALSGLISAMAGGAEYGSLLIPREIDFDEAERGISLLHSDASRRRASELVAVARVLCGKYDTVITNPPYMGKRNLNPVLSAYLEKNYKEGKSELYSAFILRALDMARDSGYVAMVTIHSWMFLSSFERLRRRILAASGIESLVHLGAGTFEELNSFNVLASAFCLCKGRRGAGVSRFLRLNDLYRAADKQKCFADPDRIYDIDCSELLSIPGAPLAYALSEGQRRSFAECQRLGDYVYPRVGLQTGNNERFVRYWFEVAREDILTGAPDRAAAASAKWVPYNKGGSFRKWYGMNEYVLDWRKGGSIVENAPGAAPNNREYYFKEGITWSLFGFENFGVRYKPEGFVFDVSGASVFPDEPDRLYILAFLASSVAFSYLSVLAPTVNFQAGNIGDLPLIIDGEKKDEISALAAECIEICRADWDDFEESWSFISHPLARDSSVRRGYLTFEECCRERYGRLKRNEERINSLFAEIYRLDGHNCEVVHRDVSVRLAERGREARSLLSYAVGCLFGRFEARGDVRYPSVIEITDGGRSGLYGRIAEWLENTLGTDTLEDNLSFIAESLGGASSEDVRKYLYSSFFRDHARAYKKCPIYWQVESGRLGAFRALVCFHGWRLDTLSDLLSAAYRRRGELRAAADGTGRKAELLREMDEFIPRLLEYSKTEIQFCPDEGIKKNREKIANILTKVK